MRRESIISYQLSGAGADNRSPITGNWRSRTRTRGFTLPKQRGRSCGPCHAVAFLTCRSFREGGFTLAEMLVSIAVLALVVLFVTQLVNSAATISTLGHKRMDADSQARQLLDRMQVDFDQMLKRNDVSYYVKTGAAMPGNDQIAFFSGVPGHYPQPLYHSNVTLASYRVNNDSTSASYNRLERMGKGLNFNAAYPGAVPILFLPATIDSIWPAATSTTLPDPQGDYQLIGPQVFRFEYHYQLNTAYSRGPWPDVASFSIKDVAAMVVDIAVIDLRNRGALTDAQTTTLGGLLNDFADTMQTPGQLAGTWQSHLDNIIDPTSPEYIPTMPRAAIQNIRVYERCFYLSQ